MGLGALLWPAESSWPGWSLKAAPQPPRVMVNRGKSGVRVSVPVCRPSLFVAACGGFWRAIVWQGQSGGWGVCCCSRGVGESPVQAALSSAGWEKSRGSSPRIKSRKKALSFCFHGCCVPSAVGFRSLVCVSSWLSVTVSLWHSVLFWTSGVVLCRH